jgi:aryl-alcohol dehydrogenase-like predicted oxidoreductase
VCEQPPYSIFARAAERDVFEVTQRFGMGVIVWSPLAGGWLTGKYTRDGKVPQGSRAERAAKQWAGSPVADRFDMTRPTNQMKLDKVEELETVAAKAGLSMTHMAIAFTLAHPAVTSAIIGPRTLDQLEDLLDGADARLDESTLDAIDEIVEPGGYFEPADLGWQPPWMSPESRRR